MYKKAFICKTEVDTKNLAECVAKIAQKGDVFALFGTLGVGKSTFSRYFIQSLSGVTDVPSPTFTLLQTYSAPEFEIYHYDMYRLKSAEEAYELDIEEAFYSGVTLVEWPEKIGRLLPNNIFKVDIETDGLNRIFSFETPSNEKYERLKGIDFG